MRWGSEHFELLSKRLRFPTAHSNARHMQRPRISLHEMYRKGKVTDNSGPFLPEHLAAETRNRLPISE